MINSPNKAEGISPYRSAFMGKRNRGCNCHHWWMWLTNTAGGKVKGSLGSIGFPVAGAGTCAADVTLIVTTSCRRLQSISLHFTASITMFLITSLNHNTFNVLCSPDKDTHLFPGSESSWPFSQSQERERERERNPTGSQRNSSNNLFANCFSALTVTLYIVSCVGVHFSPALFPQQWIVLY